MNIAKISSIKEPIYEQRVAQRQNIMLKRTFQKNLEIKNM